MNEKLITYQWGLFADVDDVCNFLPSIYPKVYQRPWNLILNDLELKRCY